MISFTISILILQYAKLSSAGHWLIDGATSDILDHKPECHSDSVTVSCGESVNKHGNYATGVRCCYDKCSFGGFMCTEVDCDSPDCTWKNKAYSTAKSLCESIPPDLINGRYNYRLCDKNELEQDKCRGSGCQFDGYHIWSSDTCTVSPCPTPQPSNDPSVGPTTMIHQLGQPSNDPSVGPTTMIPSNDPSVGPTTMKPSNDPTRGPTAAIPSAAANAEYAINLKDINFNGKQFNVSFVLSPVSKIVLCIVGILLFITCIMIIYGCLLNSRNRKNESFDVENVSDLEIQPKCASEIEKFVDQQ